MWNLKQKGNFLVRLAMIVGIKSFNLSHRPMQNGFLLEAPQPILIPSINIHIRALS